ncbi:MAG: TOBE domain-containing protein [Helicobacteraceae bacterium]|jgi:molybdopterin-binding protein|nr:TOBE domain-containing protein [Helicobacteraceae bacterium]
MNALLGEISHIETDGALSIVEIVSNDMRFSSLVVETPKSCAYLAIGRKVEVLFKETEVAIAKNLSGEISLRNRHSATISALRYGGLLCEITLNNKDEIVKSIITERSAKRLNLTVGDRVEWLVKANEISLKDLG